MKTKMARFILTMCMSCAFCLLVFAERIQVVGIVTDEIGEPIIGASVIEKGTNNGAVTDINGGYKISTEVGKILIFSYLGYERKELKVESSRHNVTLTPAIQVLEEVFVTAYSVHKKSMVTSSVSHVASDRVLKKASGKSNKISGTSFSPPAPVQSYYDSFNTEEYSTYSENRFLTVQEQPLSTFSLDVDAASYSNMRRIINQGRIPEKDMVRIEEMVNYFKYDYPQPVGEHPINFLTETTFCPWNTKHKLVKIGMKAKEISSEALPATNLVFLIDVSGSMQGATRIDLVKSSLKLLLNNLRDVDRVAIVTYANNVNEVLPSTKADDKQKIMEAIDKLIASGGTAGGAGIQLAYKTAEKNYLPERNNRIILCTDGDFNIGISSPSELENFIETKRKSGIFLTVLGYGMGNYKDNRLQALSQKGNGNHAYIDNIQEANKVLVNEFGGTMYTVANDVKIQVEFNPAYVNAYRLVGYESRMLNKEDFNDDTKDAGDMGAGHTVTALYEIIPIGVKNTFGGVDAFKYQKNDKKTEERENDYSNELLTIKLRYKQPDSDKSKKLEIPVLVDEINKKTSVDFKFAMAVAMFGQLLKDSDFKGTANYKDAIALAKEGIGEDNHGYRKEFIRLAESLYQLKK